MRRTLIFALLLFPFILPSQNLSQTLKGRITDKELKNPLIGATISIIDEKGKLIHGGVTDLEGYYKIESIGVGRITIRLSMLGYKEVTIPDISINTGKELVLNIEMLEAPEELGEVVITNQEKGRVNNEMATVSARTFDVSETKRYPASRDDIGRMVSNFAGVRGADDSRNDIVIRGNSPSGVLWRLEGIDIPNPNHFAVFGTTGGPVSILNNKTLGNSDFFTGAFPAEYGNSTAGVFDVKMKNGNSEKREYTLQLGFLGVEGVAEGPISKQARSSYIVSYRYSTLGLMKALGINFGASGIPQYQDYSVKLNFPLKNGALSFFSVGGKSDIALLDSERDSSEWTFGRSGRDIHFGSRMGVLGANYQKTIDSKTFARVSIAASGNSMYSRYDTLDAVTQVKGAQYRNDFKQGKLSLNSFISRKINTQIYSKIGIIAEELFFDFVDSSYNRRLNDFQIETLYKGASLLIHPYFQLKYNLAANITITSGLHYQYFFLNNNSSALEPRLGLKWGISENQSLSFGTGLHSQLQPNYIYFQTDTSSNGIQNHNRDVGFTRSFHLVGGYERILVGNIRAKTEVYYQYLYNIPVESNNLSAFSTVNQGGGFTFIRPGKLANNGSGKNYGIELTLERFFNKGYYLLLTGSLYESFYKGSDGISRRAEFNGNYATNILGGYEIKIGKSKTTLLNLGGKLTFAGGRRYTPIDIEKSKTEGEAVYIDSLSYSKQNKPYWRGDIRFSVRKNYKKFSHEVSLDLINAFNTKNILTQTYDARNNRIINEYQLGLLPLLNYIIDF